jgi:uncharacterized protein YegL
MEKKMDNATELVFILDKSGSMSGLESDTIGGFNGFIEKQRKEEGTCFVTTVLFDNDHVTIHDRIPLSEVPKMTEKDYRVGGCTALIDALGDTIGHIEDVHRYIRKEDVPAHTMFIITTDGLENASHKYSSADVKKKIEAKKELGWEFLFLGANIDAVETAKRYGIREDRAVNYHADAVGTAMAFKTLSKAVSSVRECEELCADWGAELEQDHKNRKSER